MSEPSSLSDRCKCSHIRFRHNYDTEDGPCSKPDCDCEAYAPVVIEDVELPEAQCTAACSEGHTYSGSCMLRAHGPRPGPCQCGCAAEAHMGRPAGCRAHGLHEFEPEPEQHECTTDVRYFCPVADATESACHGGFDTCCSDPARHVIIGPCQHGEELVAECPCTPLCGCCPSLPAPPPPQPERRPPYAIAYSVEGHLYEAWLPGDATVAAVDGVLVIQHNGRTVNGITQVLPVRQEK